MHVNSCFVVAAAAAAAAAAVLQEQDPAHAPPACFRLVAIFAQSMQ